MARTRACLFLALAVPQALFLLRFEGAAAARSTATGMSSLQRWQQVRSLLRQLNKPPVATIESPDGDIIDCVHVSKQPAFDHPLLKNHTIQMMPSCRPEGLPTKSNSATNSFTQKWHQNGKCPENTVPIRRTKEEDVLGLSSIERYGKKWPWSIPKRFSIDIPDTDNVLKGHQVFPDLYKDNNTKLFIYWTRDAYNKTGCYNLLCSGFVQTNNQIAIGASNSYLSPISTYNGSQYEFTILVWKDTKADNWWLRVGNYDLGYWPSTIFSKLADNADSIQWGGEVASPADAGQTSTQMGSGHFAEEGFRKASYIRNMQVVDSTNSLESPSSLSLIAKWPKCYNIQNGTSADWGTYIFYGGPGKNANCQ